MSLDKYFIIFLINYWLKINIIIIICVSLIVFDFFLEPFLPKKSACQKISMSKELYLVKDCLYR